MQGFHDEIDEKLEPRSETERSVFRSVCSERASFQEHNYISDLSMKVGQTEIV